MVAKMKVLIFAAVAVFCVQSVFTVDTHEHNKVVCYWNSTAFERQGKIIKYSVDQFQKFEILKFLFLSMNNSLISFSLLFSPENLRWKSIFVFLGPGKFQLDDVQSALSLCTHLIYGFAGINAETFEVVPLKPSLDTGVGYSYYKLVTQLKRTFPNLKIYLSIGGNADPDDETHKYLVLVSVLYILFYETRFGESYEYIPLHCGDGHFLLPFNSVNDSNLIKNNNNIFDLFRPRHRNRDRNSSTLWIGSSTTTISMGSTWLGNSHPPKLRRNVAHLDRSGTASRRPSATVNSRTTKRWSIVTVSPSWSATWRPSSDQDWRIWPLVSYLTWTAVVNIDFFFSKLFDRSNNIKRFDRIDKIIAPSIFLVYYDARLLAPNIDAVHLFTFDQKTPERNPREGDYPAPIYESYGRVPQDNVDSTARWAISWSPLPKKPKKETNSSKFLYIE